MPPSSITKSKPPPAPIRVDPIALRALSGPERSFGFAIEGCPPGAGRSATTASGAVRLSYLCEGTVEAVDDGSLVIATAGGRVTILFHLPRGIDLEVLLGERIRVHASLVLDDETAFELRLHRADGRLGLMAFDGDPAFIDEGSILTWDEAAHSICFALPGTPPIELPRKLGVIGVDGRTFRCICLHAGPGRAAFVLLG